MKHLAKLPPLRSWRAWLVGLLTMLGIGIMVVWTWHMLDRHQDNEYRHRFDLDIEAIGEILDARMRAYETVLRGVASAFAGDGEAVQPQVSQARWLDIVDQLQLDQLYPGISSVAWSRYLRAGEVDEFVRLVRTDGRPDYRVFPEGAREVYQLIEHIGPVTARTRSMLGVDLLTQPDQQQAIAQAVDRGQVTLSQPVPDLYEVTPEQPSGVGAMLYLTLYQTGHLPQTLGARRALLVGAVNVVFRGDELAKGAYGSRLRLFHIAAHDVDTGSLIFDSQVGAAAAPPGWEPQLSGHLDLPLYGRTWRLSVVSTPEYEQALISRSQDLVLLMGFATALMMGVFAGGFMYLRDRQMHASQKIAATLRDQAEQLMLASRYKSEFLANMSHELRTPLNSILILSDQLRQNSSGNLTEKQTRHADIVHRAGSDLLQLINDVLDLAKVEAGRMQLSMEPLNLQDLLVDLDASMRPLAEAKKLNLYIPQIMPETGVPPKVYSDRVRLHQILRNLLSNAIKFTDAGQVQLTINADKPANGRVMVHLAVRDTGIGIAPELHSQAFEAFQQLDGSTRRRFAGTGLGLAITKQLAQALDGTIELESVPGQGSTFTVHLPMQAVPVLPAEVQAAPQRSGEGPALLVVEDDANFAAIIVEQAHAHGFSSVHCMTGTQALELLQGEAFAAIILDIMLPDISGWQLFRRLRALPAHQRTPVHIISSLPQPGNLDDQGTHYLTKPIERDALEQVFSHLENAPEEGPALLLVEDVEAEREHYRQSLAALGFAVTACENGHDACALWAKHVFDVVVIDLNLPDGDGFTLLDSLDALRSLHKTRVVVNTGLDVAQAGLQRLHGYSAVVVHKQGSDTAMLGQAVQGFLGHISVAAARPDTSAPTAGAATVRPGLQGRRLLLVDDDVRNVYAMSALLDDFGLAVSTAGNGEEAIAVFQGTPLDLILMDMSMPVMDGYTATHLLKTQHGCAIPVIALTAHAMKGDREKCLAAGADDYLAKPVKREDLRAMLERWLTASPDRAER